jgi:hypothetical protein
MFELNHASTYARLFELNNVTWCLLAVGIQAQLLRHRRFVHLMDHYSRLLAVERFARHTHTYRTYAYILGHVCTSVLIHTCPFTHSCFHIKIRVSDCSLSCTRIVSVPMRMLALSARADTPTINANTLIACHVATVVCHAWHMQIPAPHARTWLRWRSQGRQCDVYFPQPVRSTNPRHTRNKHTETYARVTRVCMQEARAVQAYFRAAVQATGCLWSRRCPS